jgi:transposase
VSKLDHTLEPPAAGVRRLEVITGTGRRRRFSEDDKAGIIEETLVPGAVISEVARRHGLSPQQLFTWRRQARRHPLAASPNAAPAFVPAIVDASVPEQPDGRRKPGRRRRPGHVCGIIEVEIDGVTVRVARGADAKTVAMVIRALKAGA